MAFLSSFASPSNSGAPSLVPGPPVGKAAGVGTDGGMNDEEKADLFNTVCSKVLKREISYSRGEIYVPRSGIPVPMVSPEEWRVKRVMESCGFKTALSCVAGAGFGLVFGLFTAAVDPNITGTEIQTTRLVLKEMKARMASYSKNFAVIGAMFACTECIIESHRAKDDWCNSPMAGAVTGGLIGLRTGLTGAMLGGTGFAIFSLAIDYYMKS